MLQYDGLHLYHCCAYHTGDDGRHHSGIEVSYRLTTGSDGTDFQSRQTLQSASDAARIFNDSHTQPIILCIAATHFAETRPEQSKKMLRSAWELIRASHGKGNDGKDVLDVYGSTGLGE